MKRILIILLPIALLALVLFMQKSESPLAFTAFPDDMVWREETLKAFDRKVELTRRDSNSSSAELRFPSGKVWTAVYKSEVSLDELSKLPGSELEVTLERLGWKQEIETSTHSIRGVYSEGPGGNTIGYVKVANDKISMVVVDTRFEYRKITEDDLGLFGVEYTIFVADPIPVPKP